jgi:hypothetical protein
MADDSSTPPLSRRVPGATNRPKPKMRVAPPALPEEIVGRLRSKQTAAETTAAPPRRISGEPPAAPEPQVAPAGEAAEEPQDTWYVVPDSPASPVADSDDSTQPIPVIAATSEAPSPVKVMVDVRKEQLPRRSGGSRAAGSEKPGGSSKPAAALPARRAQIPDARPAERTADRTRPADRPKPAPRSVAAAVSSPLPVRPRRASGWRRWVARVSQAASRPGSQQQGGTLLRPLFRDSLSIEEMVAAVRAQDAGRRADLSRRYRVAAAVLLVVVIATALVVVVVI